MMPALTDEELSDIRSAVESGAETMKAIGKRYNRSRHVIMSLVAKHGWHNPWLIPTTKDIEDRAIWEPNSGCLLWLGEVLRTQYGRFRRRPAHRLSWIAANGPIPPGMFVCHRCDVRSCVNPAHLFLGTIADNNADARAKGRHSHGEKTGGAKLKAEDVVAIRADRRSDTEIARAFGISERHVVNLRSGKYWSHVS